MVSQHPRRKRYRHTDSCQPAALGKFTVAALVAMALWIGFGQLILGGTLDGIGLGFMFALMILAGS